MASCDYGCGRDSIIQLKNGKHCCESSHRKCPALSARRGAASGAARKGMQLSESHRIAIGHSGKGRVVSDELRSRISEANKKHWAKNSRSPWNKGQKLHYKVWNKGRRSNEPTPLIPGEDPIYCDFKKYRNRVSARTRATYKLYASEINPSSRPLGRCGVDGAYQIDHIISVRKGFEQKIPVEVISSKDNLQVIPWLDNIKKYSR